MLATHADREQLFQEAGRRIVELCKRYYRDDDDSVLPRSIATKAAFNNAMVLDVAMGGSSNTVLHLLAAAQEAGVDFTMNDIDSLSRKVPHLSKVSPATPLYHMEDVHRAGGIMALMGELQRANLIDTSVSHVAGSSLADVIDRWDIKSDNCPDSTKEFFRAGPAGIRTT